MKPEPTIQIIGHLYKKAKSRIQRKLSAGTIKHKHTETSHTIPRFWNANKNPSHKQNHKHTTSKNIRNSQDENVKFNIVEKQAVIILW